MNANVPPKIAFVTPELAPLVKVGGLADVSASLPPELAALGHDVRIFLPLYDTIASQSLDLVPVPSAQQVGMTLAGRFLSFNLYERRHSGKKTEPHLYLIQCAPLFEREGQVYTMHDDEHVRWFFFCRAVLESCQRLRWAPQVLHLNDWTTALLPLLLQRHYAWDHLFASTRTLLTIHNLGYQGRFGAHILDELDLRTSIDAFDADDLSAGYVNWLKTGLSTADRLVTVSPNYAREIQSVEQGHGLDVLLRERSDDLVGILNGIDEEVWNPQLDRKIPLRFGPESLWRRRRNKIELLRRVGLPEDAETPLLGMIARLSAQKGIDLLEAVLGDLLAQRPARLVILGSGDAHFEQYFEELQTRFPSRVAFCRGYDEPLSHHIEAGVDLFLMPSRYEPCGLNQMYSLRYGAIPVVHATGGLVDTVDPVPPEGDGGTGFVFAPYRASALRNALDQALDLYGDTGRWRELMHRGMQMQFGWGDRAQSYDAVLRSLAV